VSAGRLPHHVFAGDIVAACFRPCTRVSAAASVKGGARGGGGGGGWVDGLVSIGVILVHEGQQSLAGSFYITGIARILPESGCDHSGGVLTHPALKRCRRGHSIVRRQHRVPMDYLPASRSHRRGWSVHGKNKKSRRPTASGIGHAMTNSSRYQRRIDDDHAGQIDCPPVIP